MVSIILILLAMPVINDVEATTQDGKVVLLHDNGTWSYKGEIIEELSVIISNKKAVWSRRYIETINFDMRCTSKFTKPTRAVRGILSFIDLFGETRVRVRYTLTEPLEPNETIDKKSQGIDYSQFNADHKWLAATDLKDMTYKFEVQSVIYQDGTKVDFRN